MAGRRTWSFAFLAAEQCYNVVSWRQANSVRARNNRREISDRASCHSALYRTSPCCTTPRHTAPHHNRVSRTLRLMSNILVDACTHFRINSGESILVPHASIPREASVVVTAPRGIFFLTRSNPTAYSARQTPSWLHHRRRIRWKSTNPLPNVARMVIGLEHEHVWKHLEISREKRNK